MKPMTGLKILRGTVYLLAILGCSCNPNEKINLEGLWKIKAGDNIQWKEVTLDDTNWISVDVPKETRL